MVGHSLCRPHRPLRGLLLQYPVVALMLALSMLAIKRMITHLRGAALVIQTGNALDAKDIRYATSRMDARVSVILVRLVLDAVIPACHSSRGDGQLSAQQ